jgi:hypothetical protein
MSPFELVAALFETYTEAPESGVLRSNDFRQFRQAVAELHLEEQPTQQREAR